jgi:hypothetical protein
MWRSLRRRRIADDRPSSMLFLLGLGVLTVYIVNSIFDMPSAGIGYYQTEWALILTAAAVAAVADATVRVEKTANFGLSPSPFRQQYGRP